MGKFEGPLDVLCALNIFAESRNSFYFFTKIKLYTSFMLLSKKIEVWVKILASQKKYLSGLS